MAHHHERRELPFSAQQMYRLVADVDRYPEFLPWVIGTRIRSDSDTEMLADMIVGFLNLRETFSSRVRKTPGRRIEVDYLDGPLKELNNVWIFEDASGGGCIVDFTVDFTFRNRVFQTIAGQFFDKALRKMTDAFIARAEALYGSSNSSA